MGSRGSQTSLRHFFPKDSPHQTTHTDGYLQHAVAVVSVQLLGLLVAFDAPVLAGGRGSSSSRSHCHPIRLPLSSCHPLGVPLAGPKPTPPISAHFHATAGQNFRFSGGEDVRRQTGSLARRGAYRDSQSQHWKGARRLADLGLQLPGGVATPLLPPPRHGPPASRRFRLGGRSARRGPPHMRPEGRWHLPAAGAAAAGAALWPPRAPPGESWFCCCCCCWGFCPAGRDQAP